MNAFLALYVVYSIVFLFAGLIISLLVGNWDWFARSGSVVVAYTIYFFFSFDARVRSYHDRWTRFFRVRAGLEEPTEMEQVTTLRNVTDEERQRLADPDELHRSVEDMKRKTVQLAREARVAERRLAVLGTLVWGFGDIPNYLY